MAVARKHSFDFGTMTFNQEALPADFVPGTVYEWVRERLEQLQPQLDKVDGAAEAWADQRAVMSELVDCIGRTGGGAAEAWSGEQAAADLQDALLALGMSAMRMGLVSADMSDWLRGAAVHGRNAANRFNQETVPLHAADIADNERVGRTGPPSVRGDKAAWEVFVGLNESWAAQSAAAPSRMEVAFPFDWSGADDGNGPTTQGAPDLPAISAGEVSTAGGAAAAGGGAGGVDRHSHGSADGASARGMSAAGVAAGGLAARQVAQRHSPADGVRPGRASDRVPVDELGVGDAARGHLPAGGVVAGAGASAAAAAGELGDADPYTAGSVLAGGTGAAGGLGAGGLGASGLAGSGGVALGAGGSLGGLGSGGGGAGSAAGRNAAGGRSGAALFGGPGAGVGSRPLLGGKGSGADKNGDAASRGSAAGGGAENGKEYSSKFWLPEEDDTWAGPPAVPPVIDGDTEPEYRPRH